MTFGWGNSWKNVFLRKQTDYICIEIKIKTSYYSNWSRKSSCICWLRFNTFWTRGWCKRDAHYNKCLNLIAFCIYNFCLLFYIHSFSPGGRNMNSCVYLLFSRYSNHGPWSMYSKFERNISTRATSI